MSEILTSIAQPMHYMIELDAPLVLKKNHGMLMEGDAEANTIVLDVYKTRNVPANLSGITFSLYFTRPDGGTLPPIAGTVDGNTVKLTLTGACYKYTGQYTMLVAMKKGEKNRTVLKATGHMESRNTENMVDTEGIFPTPEELLEMLNVLETALQSANNAASGANAAAGNANAATNRANEATEKANKWANATAKATALSPTSQPTVNVEESNGNKVISFGIPAGKTPNITFHVSTGAPGTQVTIQQSGTPEAPVVGLTIPRGDTGAIDGIDYFAGNPSALGAASPGTANGVARGDHVHPLPTAQAIGALPTDGTAVNAEKIGGKAPQYYLQPRNLLDNSDFGNHVNQRGQTSYSGVLYNIDRWKSFADGTVVTVGTDGIEFTGESFAQIVPVAVVKTGQTYTFAVKQADGTIRLATGTYPMSEAVSRDGLTLKLDGLASQYVAITTAGTYEWAALYEGTYTAETLPPYVPKGYTQELAECQRYFVRFGGNAYTHIGLAHAQNETQLVCSVHLPQLMREGVTPSVVKGGSLNMTAKSGTTFKNISAVALNQVGVSACALTLTSESLTKGDVFDVYVPTGSWLDISADL